MELFLLLFDLDQLFQFQVLLFLFKNNFSRLSENLQETINYVHHLEVKMQLICISFQQPFISTLMRSIH